MQTLNLTITLPDIIQVNDRDVLQMQVLFVKNLVDSGRINFNDVAQRDAVLEWYLKIVPHIQPTVEENQQAKAALWREMGWPAPDGRSNEELVAAIDAEMDRLTVENNWTAETFEQWGREHMRTPYQRP